MDRVLLEGRHFSNWKVIRYVENKQNHSFYWCRCDCGVEKLVSGNYLRRGTSRSCGCLGRQLARDRAAEVRRMRPYWAALRSVHHGMLIRCYSTAESHAAQQKNYGARGIGVCVAWRDFKKFYNWAVLGYRPGLQLDRINNNKGYSPLNCRWVTRVENIQNSRVVRRVRVDGELVTFRQLSEKMGIEPYRVAYLWRRHKTKFTDYWAALGKPNPTPKNSFHGKGFKAFRTKSCLKMMRK